MEGNLACSGVEPLVLRNSIIFKNQSLDQKKAFEMVKLRSWQWLSSKDTSFSASWNAWEAVPWLCLQENLV